MTDSILPKIEALRKEAFDALQASEPFRVFKALDDAVAAVGGKRLLAEQGGVTLNGVPLKTFQAEAEVRRQRERKRMSQADGAETVLKEQGRPLPGHELIKAVQEKGVTVSSGKNALINFGSTMSRDKRFYSLRHDGTYYWWLAGVDLPAPFKNEAPDLPLQVGSSASPSFSSQEGGESHAATT